VRPGGSETRKRARRIAPPGPHSVYPRATAYSRLPRKLSRKVNMLMKSR
jgi:hypothetical protein